MAMETSAILEMSLSSILKPDLALQLQQLCAIQTVGGFLRAWHDPRGQKQIEQIFETPSQARQAAATCSAWLGQVARYVPAPVPTWWASDRDPRPDA
ncbi:MAG TPA: hypothetical protein PKB10_06530 [Tepidisphaeraceae bacterium]|nr:hypothetical protein [Tepidisphaeraceae bacterium]